MDSINERMYQANIELVDRNKLLEEDKIILQRRIDKTINYINELKTNSDEKALDKIIKILEGRYVNIE